MTPEDRIKWEEIARESRKQRLLQMGLFNRVDVLHKELMGKEVIFSDSSISVSSSSEGESNEESASSADIIIEFDCDQASLTSSSEDRTGNDKNEEEKAEGKEEKEISPADDLLVIPKHLEIIKAARVFYDLTGTLPIIEDFMDMQNVSRKRAKRAIVQVLRENKLPRTMIQKRAQAQALAERRKQLKLQKLGQKKSGNKEEEEEEEEEEDHGNNDDDEQRRDDDEEKDVNMKIETNAGMSKTEKRRKDKDRNKDDKDQMKNKQTDKTAHKLKEKGKNKTMDVDQDKEKEKDKEKHRSRNQAHGTLARQQDELAEMSVDHHDAMDVDSESAEPPVPNLEYIPNLGAEGSEDRGSAYCPMNKDMMSKIASMQEEYQVGYPYDSTVQKQMLKLLKRFGKLCQELQLKVTLHDIRDEVENDKYMNIAGDFQKKWLQVLSKLQGHEYDPSSLEDLYTHSKLLLDKAEQHLVKRAEGKDWQWHLKQWNELKLKQQTKKQAKNKLTSDPIDVDGFWKIPYKKPCYFGDQSRLKRLDDFMFNNPFPYEPIDDYKPKCEMLRCIVCVCVC
ncbi:hypothetical protein RFI_11739 [Reticulomyxa filosa]|uniref:Uncharacterized protein n=1 Tax=Reticulomyxa filosa TaxID=46433 RepID=X6NHP9_RETFI|nr:hypothetical protein RFI_11739 [Reticulomyxa filosa]|eukprot:ETO25398.1 hypothetical protein RFI_11739 [Reticulomyxa filosa]